MDNVQLLQWGLLAGYAALSLCAAVTGWKRPAARPAALAALFLAVPHLVLYVSFLVVPDWLDARQTMILSLVIRYQVLFVTALALALAVVRSDRWRA